jgi:hypothetical protein
VLPIFLIVLAAVTVGSTSKPQAAQDEKPATTVEAKEQEKPKVLKHPPVGELDPYDFNKLEAWVYAQHFVEQLLKAPPTAEFASHFDVQGWHEGEGKYRLRGWVDSQNSFGAMIRTHVEVTVQKVEGGWQLLDFKQLPR